MEHLEIIVAALMAFALAWLFDALTGRRGLAAPLLVAGTGALCGGFLAVRVFAVTTLDRWDWLLWALAGTALALFAHFLFRNTR